MSSELRKYGSTSVVQTSNIGFTSEVSDYLVVHTGLGRFPCLPLSLSLMRRKKGKGRQKAHNKHRRLMFYAQPTSADGSRQLTNNLSEIIWLLVFYAQPTGRVNPRRNRQRE